MKRYIFFLLFFYIQFNIFPNNSPDTSKINFTLKYNPSTNLNLFVDNTSDQDKKEKIAIDNPFKDTNWDWFSEKYRPEKIILSAGIVSMVIGTPLFFVGIFEYFLPQADKSTVGDAACFSLMGVGAGIIAVGITLTIVGAVRLNYLRTKDKIEVSLSIDL